MTPAHPASGEERTAGLIYFRRTDGIIVYRFTDSARETIDAWAKHVLKTETEAGAQAHVQAIYDIRGQWITAYGIQTMFHMSRMTVPDLISSVAVVGDSLVLATIRIILNHLPENRHQERRIFSSEEAALKWLAERRALMARDPQ
jgi:hypothetical protein